MSTPTLDADFEAQVAGLAGGVPVALLPVRLEARFVGNELRVRIFPDQIHLDSHEAELTEPELDAGMVYWRERFAAPDPATRTTSPWATLCAVVEPARAAWVVEALTPVNRSQLGQPVTPTFPATGERSNAWSLAARAVALPQRWVVIGIRGGVEVCRAWTGPVADRLDVTPAPDQPAGPTADDALALQDSARWLVDFDAAERAGMAIRIPAAAVDGGLTGGFDSLEVLGVDWSHTPVESAEAIRGLLSSHLYADGLSAISPGTPTNVTAAARPGGAPGRDALIASLDPERRPSASSLAGTGVQRLIDGLGLPARPDDVLTAIPGATERPQEIASRLADALWESTLGSFLTDALTPVFPDARTAVLREHVRRYLFPAGPLPALRIAKQPYGVLPVVAGGFVPDPADPIEAGLVTVLAKLRIFWEQSLPAVPRLGRTADLDADLTDLLQTTPVTAAVRYRTVLGPLTVSSTVGLDRHAVAQQYISSMLGVHLGVPPPTVWNEFALHPGQQRLDAWLVDPSTGATLAQIATVARTSASYDAMKAQEDQATSLLEALAVYATARELHRADLATINAFRLASGQIDALPPVGVLPLAEYVGIEATEPPPEGSVRVSTPSEVSRVVIPGVTGQRTVREFVTAALGRLTVPPEYGTLLGTLANLDALSTGTVAELDHALRGLLDAYGHRLDAWYTSLATRRLARVRTAAPTGVHLGGYGWLEDLRPATEAAPNHGFIHAPSLPQAATAAVLRSGHLAHHDAEHQALEIDLTAERVRIAMTLLDGVAQGQPLAALLGYRFERAVRSRGVSLAQYILPIRRMVPLRPDGAPAAAPTTSDHLAARDVVDGVALLERWRTEGPALFDALQEFVTWPPPPAEVFVMPPQSERDVLAAELDRLADCYDAVADVLTAESVHQQVLGNHERAAASLAALDRQDRPPRLEFVRTPRSGKSYTQRLLVLIGDDTFPVSWPAPVRDPRSDAEPRLNAWLARIIGNPRRVRFAAAVEGTTSQLTVSLDQLGLSPLAAVLAGQRSGQDAPSELEDRLRYAFATLLPASAQNRTVTLLDAPPRGANPGTVGLGAFRALTRWAYALIATQRAATTSDLALPQDEVSEQRDEVELRARADALVTAYAAALEVVENAAAAPAQSDEQLRTALLTAAGFGVDGAVPPPPTGGDPAEQHDDLLVRLRTMAATMVAAEAREHALTDSDGGPQRLIDHQTERIRALLGKEFPVLPRFTASNPAALTASRAARMTLCGGDDLAPGVWLRRLALVRDGVDRFARVRGAAELIRSSDVVPRDLVVLQLPHTPGERWLALPFTAVPAAQLAVVAHCSGTVDFTAPLAGLFCDGWSEIIPGREETTGLTFHHDAPGARAPQTLLLAVPPEATDPHWSVETLRDTLIEARQLARIRGVGPDRLEWLGTLLPAILLPDSVSPDVPSVSLKKLAARTATPGQD